jgi:membrane associated rhomboid family serine protease
MIPLRVDILRNRFAYVNALLISINVMAFLHELTLSPKLGRALVYSFGLIPAHEQLLFAKHGGIGLAQAIVPMFTSMFLHGGWMHLLGNMLFLWVFGGAVEEALGHFQYLSFYLICGAGSALTHTLFNLGSKVPTVGASGAISGVMGAFIVLFPTARVTTLIPALLLFFRVRIPAYLMLGYWFFLQFFSGVASLGMTDQGGVAWWAHVGGFVLGAVLVVGVRTKMRSAAYG